LRKLPDGGIGYGQLRHLNAETKEELRKLGEPEIGFNYLGRFGIEEAQEWGIAPESGSLGGGADEEMGLWHSVEVNALTVDRATGPELVAEWTWATRLLTEEDVRELAEGWFEGLKALVEHSRRPGAGGMTPSDAPLAPLSQSEIERLERDYPGLEEIWPLTPLQEGLVFHALYDSRGMDVYTTQMVFGLEGEVDEQSLEHAARALLVRHANLRVAIRHEGLSRPVQVIASEVALPWERIDLSRLGERERTAFGGVAGCGSSKAL
jgi:non-ribosomal peptide synthase protein (TIGR01720 family)